MSFFLNPKVITLAMLASLAPFAIDTYLPAFHIIALDLHSNPNAIQQSLTFYLAPYTLMTLFHGAISDSIGRIKTMKFGLGLFFFASIGCALSTTVEMLWFFRVLQGIGGGAGNVVARAMVRDLYQGPEAQRVMATIQIIFGIAPAVAPMIGGLLLAFHWQVIFIFLAIYAALSIFLAKKILPETIKKKDLKIILSNDPVSKFYNFKNTKNQSVDKVSQEVLGLLEGQNLSESEKGEVVLKVLRKIMKFFLNIFQKKIVKRIL